MLTEYEKMITPPDEQARENAVRRMAQLAKPVGSLGELENMIVRIAALTGTVDISKKAVCVFSADNGVLAQGVAMTPGEITGVMTEFIADGRSSVGIMAKCAGADVFSVDMGMLAPAKNPAVIDRRIAAGTADFTKGPAMTRDQALRALRTGVNMARELAAKGYRLLATGEMGIGNTTTSSAVACVLLGRDPDELTGRGVGLTDEGRRRKVAAIRRGIEINRPDPSDAIGVLSALGGFDIAAMAGMFIGGALARVPVIADGIISTVAALLALRLCPSCAQAIFPSHISAEPAALPVLHALGLRPIICADMRLGEGTGAVAAMPLFDMAAAVYSSLITYGDIGM